MDTLQRGRQQASRGFTLIEMSIVLVIIGLIIGGILKGQELVNAAREKALINQSNAIRAAQNTYFERHNALPGNDPNGASMCASGACTGGTGNGQIGATSWGAPSTITVASLKTLMNASSATSENVSYFAELVAENLIGGAAPISAATTPAGFGTANNSPLPSAPFSGSGFGVGAASHPGNTTNSTTVVSGANWLVVWSFVNSAEGGVTPRQAGHIDNEIDDGNPDTGLIRGENTNCNAANASVYGTSATIDTQQCDLMIEVQQ